jgi:translocation and assembly module TamB
VTRRRIVVLSSAVSLLGLGLLAALVVAGVLKTQFGRDFARDYIARLVAPKVTGKLYIGRITGLSFGGATIDSAEIRSPDDSAFVALGQLTVRWDPRDLVDKRTLLSLLEIDRLVVHLRKDSTGTWNYKRVFPPGRNKKRVPGAERGWGDYVVADSVVLRRATFILSMPWHPDDSLRGARRDSAIARNLTRRDKEVRRFGSGFERTWRWNNIELVSGYTRLADPDSVGRLFQIASLNADEMDPPFRFRNVRGGVRQTADSLWAEVSHFDLPGSTGTGAGKIWWGSDLPTRYDLRIVGDSVSLADVNWVYPTLPTKGGGSMVLNIRNQKNLSIIDYALSDMDVRTTKSRLKGDMTFGVGGPVLIVKDLAMEAAPMNFDLIRALNGKPFPYDWQGDLTGTVRARGGPVNRFHVDDAKVTFADANVPGAVTRATAKGDLDILFPAFTTFRGFDVNVAQLDLRTLVYLNKNFPRVTGIVSGTATLDSVWLDVRFRNADLTHRDGPAEPTRATGSGRVTLGNTFTSYDLALNTQPLSFTTLARSYPSLPLRGSYQGPLRIQGTVDDLALTTELTGPGGTLSYDGRIDAYPKTYAAKGTLTFANLDARTLLGNDTIPSTSLTGRMELDVSADSSTRDSTLTSLSGVVSATIDRSFVDSMRVYQAIARLGFTNGRLRIDTVRVETVAGAVTAHGAFGLTSAVTDSLVYKLKIDSLGGLRRYLGTPATATLDGEAAPPDSIDGTVTIVGSLHGNLDSLSILTDTLEARDIWIRGDHAKAIVGGLEYNNVRGAINGGLSIRTDTAVVANMAISRGTLAFRASDVHNGQFKIEATTTNGPSLLVQGNGSLYGDTTTVRLDTLFLSLRDHRLVLERPATVVMRPDAIVLDTIRIRDRNAGLLTLAGSVPVETPVSLSIRADSVELGDIGELVQANVPFGGLASVTVDVTGLRRDPRMKIEGRLDQPRFGDVHLDLATFAGTYETKRMESKAELFRKGKSVLSVNASIPVDLQLASVPNRMLSDSLHGNIRSDSVELAMLETVSPLVVKASGTFAANLDIGGVWPRPTLLGNLLISNGALGLTPLGAVRLSDLNANLNFVGDSLQIERFTVTTREERVGNLALNGYASLADRDNPRFDLTVNARNFHLIEKPRVAHLDVSASNLRLAGSYDHSTLTGLVIVDRGTIYIPDLIDKQVISLDSPDLYNIIDTTLTANRSLLPKAPPALVRNLAVEDVQIRMGNDVWLRSAEANINLGGSVAVRNPQRATAERAFDQLALEGTLTTNRGTYRLNLGIVQPKFVVETGTVQFLGDPDFNALLNINATNTVHRMSSTNAAEQDIQIRVHIGGTLVRPQLSLSSADSLLNISQTDLISYLLTGAPSFAVTSQTAAASLLRGFGGYLGDQLRGFGLFDVVDIELGRQGFSQGQTFTGGIFNGARLGVGRQLGDRTFVSASAGLCQFGSLLGGSGSATSGNLAESIGVKVDYRLNESVGVSAGYEPATSALLCTTGLGPTRRFAPTPPQWGFDIFRTWRF